MVNEVRSLKDCKVAACGAQGVTSDKQMGRLNRDVNFSRDAIFNEVREVNEREKRKCSIILREFGYNSVNDVCDKFKEVCHVLNIGSIELNDVIKIGDKSFIRAKVLNDEKHTELLMATSKLRSIRGFENFYIQKDLTYHQRQELAERKRKSRMSAVVGDESSASAAGVSFASSLGMSKNASRGRGRERGSGRGQVLGCDHSQVTAKVGRKIYGGTPQIV